MAGGIASTRWRAGAEQVGRATANAFRQLLVVLAAAGLAVLGAGLAMALVSYSPTDPSFNNVTERAAVNWFGVVGAHVADLGLQGFGYAAALPVLLPLVQAVRLLFGLGTGPWRRATAMTAASVPLAAAALGMFWPQPAGTLSNPGGAIGVLAANLAAAAPWPDAMDPAVGVLTMAILAAVAALVLWGWGANLPWSSLRAFRADAAAEEDDGYLAEGYPADRPLAGGSAPATVLKPRQAVESPPAPAVALMKSLVKRVTPQPEVEDAIPAAGGPEARPIRAPVAAIRSKREQVERQNALALGDQATLPPLSLLKPAPRSIGGGVDEAALEQNARMLEGVLEDFGVKGRIVGLAQGPVVTLYELEPAPGIKASRVIGLADDIARNMSAVSARVAVIPGRNVIGIELPNQRREMVSLSELIASESFERSSGTLPIVLGKDISGGPVVSDLAPMPHLLIAGTTGSGKSVGLNAIILSLLYRMRPDQCRMIMIDPKMLELSVYDEIPHLLSPVVTEPQKAVRALKWAVEQMEDRYRNMAHVNVRSLAGFNEKVRAAKAAGQTFTKKIQTGWDEEGRPIFEEQTLPLETLPLIVVVVDELADLMMTAGKEVEYLIQRLAQKARAAGIHLIMATQRPSVDVITGVIKANLPTRISFQVTSKIDSRTILGEQGAEQLLGKGDMLYMPGGKQVVRVHGPFVSDEEVEAVAAFWKAQGTPDYVSSVTEEPDLADGGEAGSRGAGGVAAPDGEADMLTQAIQVVATSRKASISYVQRQLRVGYNSAARLIEEMEQMGLISAPDHVGRREVLMDESGARL